MAEERIQKILARAGLGSRRACEDIIAAGRVSVNGLVVTEPGSRADADTDDVRVDGKPVQLQERAYYMLNKPAGCLTTVKDDRPGRDTVMRFVAHLPVRVFPVGRLDKDTRGLLLFTNHGELAQRVLHPSHGVIKTYEAVVRDRPGHAAVEQLQHGVTLGDGPTAPAEVILAGTRTVSAPCRPSRTGPVEKLVLGHVLILRIHEGRKRIVRRMLKKVGHPVLALRRTAIGRLELGELPEGELRPLARHELDLLFKKPE